MIEDFLNSTTLYSITLEGEMMEENIEGIESCIEGYAINTKVKISPDETRRNRYLCKDETKGKGSKLYARRRSTSKEEKNSKSKYVACYLSTKKSIVYRMLIDHKQFQIKKEMQEIHKMFKELNAIKEEEKTKKR